jgi:hypothetical protein
MISKEDRLEILEIIKQIFITTPVSCSQVSYDEDSGDCVYTLRKVDILRSIDKMKKDEDT